MHLVNVSTQLTYLKYHTETSAKTQLVLTHITLFYKLHHPLRHGPFIIQHDLKQQHINVYLADYAVHDERSIGSLFCKGQKVRVLITGYECHDLKGQLNDDEGHIVPNGSDNVRSPIYNDDRLRTIIGFYIVLITDEIVWLW